MRFKIIQFCFFILIIGASGCGLNKNWNINYNPVNLEKSPLNTVQSKSFFLQVEDNRPDNEKGFVGYYVKPIGKNIYTSELPPKEIIYTAIKKVFVGTGHKIITDEKNKTFDLIIVVKLNKFLQDHRPTLTKGDKPNELVGQINADIEIKNANGDNIIFKKNTNTNTIDPLTSAFAESYEVPYKKTIKQFIDDFISDYEFIEALKNN